MIQMLNPKLADSEFIDELREATERVLTSGKYIMGQEVSAFENKCCEYLDSKFAFGCSSGTDALILALMALDIGPGDEVIVPSFTFFATASAVARVGATPVFADINPTCFTLDVDDVEEAITPRTKAIIPVHLFGQCADMDRLMFLAEEYELFIIEDTCQAFGASLDDAKAGTIGDLGCYSFFPSKNLGGFGDGGMVVCQDEELAAKIKKLRVHGMGQPYEHEMLGGNFRMDEFQAALLSEKIKYVDQLIEKRIQHADYYEQNLSRSIMTPMKVRGKHTYNQYTIRTTYRKDLMDFLIKNDIGSAVYYPKPLHQQKVFDGLSLRPLPATEWVSKEVVSLPVAPELTDEEIKNVIDAINRFMRDAG